jgi:hypothetical protein
MPRPKFALALLVLACTMLVGCKEPAGLPNSDVHAATTQTVYCHVYADNPSGHIDAYAGGDHAWDYFEYYTPTITRAFYYYQLPVQPPAYDTFRAYPRKNGYCVFGIPGFNWTGDLPVCTLFYYQTAHNGSPDLRVNAWYPTSWPPGGRYNSTYFMAIWNSTDIVATDSAHASDNNWYGVPLTYWATCAIADSGSSHYMAGDTARFTTGWIYPSYSVIHGVNGWYADVSGSGDYKPYIKVVYTPGP